MYGFGSIAVCDIHWPEILVISQSAVNPCLYFVPVWVFLCTCCMERCLHATVGDYNTEQRLKNVSQYSTLTQLPWQPDRHRELGCPRNRMWERETLSKSISLRIPSGSLSPSPHCSCSLTCTHTWTHSNQFVGGTPPVSLSSTVIQDSWQRTGAFELKII